MIPTERGEVDPAILLAAAARGAALPVGEGSPLVGFLTIVLGSVVVLAAIFNWQWYYDLHKARWVESICGRQGARVVFAFLGVALIVLGGAIAVGYSLAGSPRTNEQNQDPRRRQRTIQSTASFCLPPIGV